MNTLKDIEQIIKDYFLRAGLILHAGGSNHDFTAAKRAEDCFSKGLAKLKALKLSSYDRHNLRLLRKAFELGIKCTKELQRGRLKQAERLADESAQYAQSYRSFVLTRIDKV